ncbi:MAG: hypothetical protein SH809_04305 [Rhodothermales bacterium]|nr:hypothetical protein [Rhodothermales bacterium]
MKPVMSEYAGRLAPLSSVFSRLTLSARSRAACGAWTSSNTPRASGTVYDTWVSITLPTAGDCPPPKPLTTTPEAIVWWQAGATPQDAAEAAAHRGEVAHAGRRRHFLTTCLPIRLHRAYCPAVAT